MTKVTGATEGVVLLRWGATVPGRETLLADVFVKGVAYLDKLADRGEVGHRQTYLAMDGDLGRNGGFMLVTGTLDELRALQATEAWQRFQLAMTGVSEGVEIGLYGGGTGGSLQALVELHLDVQDQLGFFGRQGATFVVDPAD